MRTTLKIVLPLIISVVVVSLFYATYQVRTQKRMARNELARHAGDLAESLRESVEQVFDKPVPDKGLQRLVDRFGQREHLKGIVVYNANGAVRVRFPWDQRPVVAGVPSSAWVRVSHYWAGIGYGALHTPRVGHAVLVALRWGQDCSAGGEGETAIDAAAAAVKKIGGK